MSTMVEIAKPFSADGAIITTPTKTPERAQYVAARIPGGKAEGSNIICEWTHDNAEVLAVHNEQAASPLLRDFKFTGRYTPFPHQYTYVNEQAVHHRYFNLGEMGTAKTATGVWTAMYLRQIGKVRRVLVVAPLTILKESWANTIFQLDMQTEFTIIHHTDRRKKQQLAAKDTFWHIINFEGVVAMNAELQRNNYDMIIIDECRKYANPSNASWKAMRKLIHIHTRVIGFTGTPRPKSPMDVYGQVKLINPSNMPHTYTQWRDKTMVNTWGYNWEERPIAVDLCAKALTPGRVVYKRDVLKDLPPVTYTFRVVELSDQQRAYYKALSKDRLVEANGMEIKAVNAAVLQGKLLQVAAGTVYTSDGQAIQFECPGRVAEVLELIEASIGATLIFVPFRHTLEMLRPHLAHYNFEFIDGDVPPTKRAEIFARLQAGELGGICAIPSTMSHGVTATAATTTIWWAPINSTDTFIQANNRTDRPGQKHPVSVYMLYGSEVERETYQSRIEQRSAQAETLSVFKKLVDEFK